MLGWKEGQEWGGAWFLAQRWPGPQSPDLSRQIRAPWLAERQSAVPENQLFCMKTLAGILFLPILHRKHFNALLHHRTPIWFPKMYLKRSGRPAATQQPGLLESKSLSSSGSSD